jgi:hypothetical protein
MNSSDRIIRKEDGLTCGAFPDGIPDEILDGSVSHKNSNPGHGGISWNKIVC